MGKLWSIIEEWRDGMEYPPSDRQIAIDLGVSQSALPTWKHPVKLPERRNLLAVSRLTRRPYRVVVEAAIEDVGLFDETAAEDESEAYRERRKLKVVATSTRLKRRGEPD